MLSAATSGFSAAQVLDPLLDRDPDRAGRVVDDHVADLGQDRLGDRAEVLDLIGGRAVRRAGVDVDLRGALVDRAPRLGRVLLRRVGDRRALVAVGDHAADRAADHDRVVEASSYRHHPVAFRRASRRACLRPSAGLDDRRPGLARVDDVVDHRVAGGDVGVDLLADRVQHRLAGRLRVVGGLDRRAADDVRPRPRRPSPRSRRPGQATIRSGS